MPRSRSEFNRIFRVHEQQRRAAQPDPDESEWKLVNMPPGDRRDLNKAGMRQLMSIYMIGEGRAKTIIDARDRMPNGEFLTWGDVKDMALVPN